MIKFSKNIIEQYQENSDIFIEIINSGCDGNSLQIFTEKNSEKNFQKIESNFSKNTQVHIEEIHFQKINGGFISQTGNKIILSHPENILTHCGCGKSFSFKSGNEAKDKIAILRKKLKQKTTHHE